MLALPTVSRHRPDLDAGISDRLILPVAHVNQHALSDGQPRQHLAGIALQRCGHEMTELGEVFVIVDAPRGEGSRVYSWLR